MQGDGETERHTQSGSLAQRHTERDSSVEMINDSPRRLLSGQLNPVESDGLWSVSTTGGRATINGGTNSRKENTGRSSWDGSS